MALVLNDRVKETSTSTGTGTFDLDGALTGFETFVAGIATGNTTYYCISHQTADEWEVGLGTVTDATPDTLSRDTVISSSNGDAKVVFTAGTSDVFCTFPANKTMDMALTTTGDTVYASAANTPARLAVGTALYTLQTNSGGTLPEWAASPQSLLTGQGDLLYTSAANTLARLAAGTGAYHLAMNSGGTAPEWVEATSGLEWQSVVTGTTQTAVAGRGYPINTTSNVCTVTLPAGSVGDTVALIDYAGTWDTNNCTVAADGSEKIQGSTDDAVLSTEREGVTFVYVDATQGWLAESSNDAGLDQPAYVTASGGTETTDGDYKIHTFTGDGTLTVTGTGNPGGGVNVDWLVIAGGGGTATGSPAGFTNGGGGAGGLVYQSCQTSLSASPGSYPIVIGGGGAGVGHSADTNDGSNSTFNSLTGSGGGGGGSNGPGSPDGNAGGSGGGGSTRPGPSGAGSSGGTGNQPAQPGASGSAGFGTAGGGFSNVGSCPGRGGGGGGSGGAGTTASGSTAQTGGPGKAYSISGSSVTYAAGGYGGGDTSPSCGSTANSGDGGNAGSHGTGSRTGGPGVVVVRYKFQN